MAKQLSLSGIQSGDVIEAEHVTQSINAFTGAEAYDITVSGSLTMQGPLTGTPETLNSFSASYALTASHALNVAIPTLQQVTDAGSITTTPITASIISASNNIITNNLTSSNNILIKGGLLEIKNQGTQSSARFYCEDDNLHYTEIKAQSHSLYTGNKTMLLPSYNFDFITPNFQANITASGNISASGYISASSFNATPLTINQLTASHAMTASFVPNEAIFPFSGSAVITGSLVISSSNQDQTLQLYGSGSTIFSIEGSRGTLFSIDDDESDGKLFSVNNVSGTPVLEVHEDNTVKIGKQDGFGIVISGSNPLPSDNDAKILITGSIHNVGSTAYFDTNITASGNISASGYISASSFNATPGTINELTASHAISSSFAQTASYVENAQTASYVENAQTASYIDASNIKQPFTNLTSSNLLITGTASINLLYTTYESSSIIYSSGSTKFGDTFDDFHQFTGSISSTGSYVDFTGATGVSGSFSGSFAGDGSELTNIPASGITGLNLSRIASGSVTASIAPNKGFEVNTNITASGNISASGYISASEFIGLVTTAQTASYVTTAQTASFVTTAQTASYVENAQTASFITGSNVYGPHGSNSVISSSHAITASHALNVANSPTLQMVTNAGNVTTSSMTTGAITVNTGSGGIVIRNESNTKLTLPVHNPYYYPTLKIASTNFQGYQTSGNLMLISNSGYSIKFGTNLGYMEFSSAGHQILQASKNIYLKSGGANTRLFVSQSGNIGINKSSSLNADLDILGNQIITGSLEVTGGITGSLLGTASYAVSSSYAVTASHALNVATPTLQDVTTAGNTTTQDIQVSGSVNISSSATIGGKLLLDGSTTNSPLEIQNGGGFEINFLDDPSTPGMETNIKSPGIFQFITSNKGYGFGVNNTDFKAVIGSSSLANNNTSILLDTYEGRFILSGSGKPNEITGSISVSGSVINELTASHAITASHALNVATPTLQEVTDAGSDTTTAITGSNISASGFISASEFIGLVTTAQTASYVENAQTASYVTLAQTASFVTTAQTASYVETAQTASFITGSNVYGPHGSNSVISSSHAITSSFALTTIDPFPYTGSAIITGSLIVTGSAIVTGTGSFNRLEVSDNSRLQGDLRVDDNVGIGTTAGGDGAKLNVRGTSSISADSYGRIEIIPTIGNGGTGVIKQTTDGPRNSGNLQIQVDRRNQSGNLYFATNGNNKRMTIDSSGNVGIGTTSPKQKLHVQGNITASGYVSASSFVNNTPGTINQLTASYAVTASHALNVATPTLQIVTDAGASTTTTITGSNISASGFISASEFVGSITTAKTASYVLNAQTASYVTLAQTASFVTTAQTASFVTTAQTASFVESASYALNASFTQTASYVENAQTASYVENAQTASFVTGSNVYGPLGSNSVISSSHAITASHVLNVATPTLQDVTTAGNTTTQDIQLSGSLSLKNRAPKQILYAGANGLITGSDQLQYESTGNDRGIYFTTASSDGSGNPDLNSGIFGVQLLNMAKDGGGGIISNNSTTFSDPGTSGIAFGPVGGATDGSTGSVSLYSDSSQAAFDARNDGKLTLRTGGSTRLTIDDTNSTFSTNITASSNISASGIVYALGGQFGMAGIGMGGLSVEGMAVMSHISSSGDIIANSLDIRGASGNITASGNISASGYISASSLDATSGSFKSLDVFENLPVTTGSKFRVGRTDSQYIGIGVGDYDNIILAKQDADSNMPHNFILDRDFEGIGANNFKIQKDGIDQFIIDTHGNITASGNISASGNIISNTGSFNRLEINDSSLLSGSTIITGSLSVEGPTAITGALFVSASKEQLPDGILMRIGDNSIGPKLEFSQSYDGGGGAVDSSVFKIRGNENGNFGINLGVAGSTPEAFISSTSNNLSLDTKLQIEKFGSTDIEPQFITRNSHFTWSLHSAASWNINDYTSSTKIFQVNPLGNVQIGRDAIDTNYLFDVSGSTRLQGNTTAHDIQITGSAIISSSNSITPLTLQSSGSTVFEVQGSQGQLFSVTDDLIHDVLLVNDISGNELFKVSGSGLVEVFEGSITTPQGTINSLTASHAMNIQPENNFMPVATHTSNFTSTSSYAGYYNIVGGNLAVTVTTGSVPTDLTPGMEWNFFQTASAGNFTFTAGTGVNILSRNMHVKLAAIGSAGTLKYISGQTFHLIGDLTL